MALTLSLRKDRKDNRRHFSDRHADAVDAVRSHLDNVEMGSPLLYPF